MFSLLLISFFTLAKAASQATSSSNCVGTISSLSDVSTAVKCTTVNINAFTVPARETFRLSLLQGTTVNVLGEIKFGNASWHGPLFELIGQDITFNGNKHIWDGGGPFYWDGKGSSGTTKPDPMMSIEMSGKLSHVYAVNSPERGFALSNHGPGSLLVSGVTVDNSQGNYPNDKSDGHPAGRNTDGFDVCGNDIVIKNSAVINQDDCMTINRGKNIVFEGNFCDSGHGISIGSISSGGVVEDVIFRGNTIVNSVQAFRIKTEQTATGGRVANITYSDNTAKNCTSYGVLVTQSYPSTLGNPGNGVIISDINFVSDPTEISVSDNAQTVILNCGEGSCTGKWDWSGLRMSGEPLYPNLLRSALALNTATTLPFEVVIKVPLNTSLVLGSAMDICNEDVCWLCSISISDCGCASNSPWSKSLSQSSFCAFDGHEKLANFDELAFYAIGRDSLFMDPFENKDFEIDVMAQYLGGGSQQPYAVSTAKNNNYNDSETWDSPGTVPPPESSSPSVDVDSSPSSLDQAMLMPLREDHSNSSVDRPEFGHSLNNGQLEWMAKAPLKTPVDSSPSFCLPTISMATFIPPSVDPSESAVPESIDSTSQGFLDDPPSATIKRPVLVDVQDACGAAPRTATKVKRTDQPPRQLEGYDGANLARKLSTSFGSENGRPCDATNSNKENRDEVGPAGMPSGRTSIASVPTMAQGKVDESLKRRHSSESTEYPEESKKAKFDHFVSFANNSCAESGYQATNLPARLRRAESLNSKVFESPDKPTCVENVQDSHHYYYTPIYSPKPITPTSASPPYDRDAGPPTIPSSPLPDSVDYARAKANPLARTLPVYRHRSFEIPRIPSVPIIAPPSPPPDSGSDVTPTEVVRGPEDEALDRIKALLLRECSEREKDGLHIHDEKRLELLKVLCPNDPSFARRQSDNRSGSDSSTYSATESHNSEDPVTVGLGIITAEDRVANRSMWADSFGITNEFRKQITRWILEKVPKKPVSTAGADRRSRDDENLYDQLMNVPLTRFHAAHLFHRYFLQPEKVRYWREVYECDCRELGSPDYFMYENSIWDFAVTCITLSVKLHRDCLRPLRPVWASAFMALAPHSTSKKTLEVTECEVLYGLQFRLETCTPQDVLDELWNALPTLRSVATPVGWQIVQEATWDTLYKCLLEPDMMQYPITLLTAAALAEGLGFALATHYMTAADEKHCVCEITSTPSITMGELDAIKEIWWSQHFEESEIVVRDDVIPDIRDALRLSETALTECREWLRNINIA